MTRDTVLGAGGLLSEWAVWAGGMAVPEKEVATATEDPRQTPREDGEADLTALKTRYELLKRENELLRQRLAIADRQVEVKDSQVNDFKAITENLTRQNQVLLMLAQGVPMERILRGGTQEIDVRLRRDVGNAEDTWLMRGRGKKDGQLREKIVSKIRELARSGLTRTQMADALNEEGVATLSGVGKWDRKKVSRAIRSSAE